jgi:hypothetical protein
LLLNPVALDDDVITRTPSTILESYVLVLLAGRCTPLPVTVAITLRSKPESALTAVGETADVACLRRIKAVLLMLPLVVPVNSVGPATATTTEAAITLTDVNLGTSLDPSTPMADGSVFVAALLVRVVT